MEQVCLMITRQLLIHYVNETLRSAVMDYSFRRKYGDKGMSKKEPYNT